MTLLGNGDVVGSGQHQIVIARENMNHCFPLLPIALASQFSDVTPQREPKPTPDLEIEPSSHRLASDIPAALRQEFYGLFGFYLPPEKEVPPKHDRSCNSQHQVPEVKKPEGSEVTLQNDAKPTWSSKPKASTNL